MAPAGRGSRVVGVDALGGDDAFASLASAPAQRGGGPIYQGRFKSFPIQEDEHLLAVMRYVERNALRAGLVERAEDWRWGSLWLRGRSGGLADELTDELTDEERALRSQLEDGPVARPRQWRTMVNRPQRQAELEALRLSVAKGRPYGGAAWSDRVAKRMGIAMRGPGRPRKDGAG